MFIDFLQKHFWMLEWGCWEGQGGLEEGKAAGGTCCMRKE